jgi:hypothetical protein
MALFCLMLIAVLLFLWDFAAKHLYARIRNKIKFEEINNHLTVKKALNLFDNYLYWYIF